MPCSTMFENAALLVSAAVELYFIKINEGGGNFYEFLQVKVLWELNKGLVMILISISLEITNSHSLFCCSPSLRAWFGLSHNNYKQL